MNGRKVLKETNRRLRAEKRELKVKIRAERENHLQEISIMQGVVDSANHYARSLEDQIKSLHAWGYPAKQYFKIWFGKFTIIRTPGEKYPG